MHVDRLNISVNMFGMCFTPSKGKLMLQNWINSKPNFVPSGGRLSEVDRFSYFSRCVSIGGRLSDEMFLCI